MENNDSRKKCSIEGCNNLGEWYALKRGRVYRRKLCSNHRFKLLRMTTKQGKLSYAREIFKKDKCKICEYCNWEGPCDVHRPISGKEGGKYTKDNMRSICPNCHRLINLCLMVDKFKINDIA